MTWYKEAADVDGTETQFVVLDGNQLGASRARHTLTAWKNAILHRLSEMIGDAAAETMQTLRERLTVTLESEDRLRETTVTWPWDKASKDGPWFVRCATLRFPVDADHAQNVRDLLAQPKKVHPQTGEALDHTNTCRFIHIEEPDSEGRFWVTSELVRGSWKQGKPKKGKPGKMRYVASKIQVTTGLQRLIETYLRPPLLRRLPAALRPGVCQETAQQLMSCLGNLTSTKVKGSVQFPTVEDRNPARRRAAYEAAIDALTTDARPLAYARARDLDPGAYSADDPRGNRRVCADERWLAVTRTPEPKPISLRFVSAEAVRIVLGEGRFDAGVSKANRHRGTLEPSEAVRASRPEQVRRKGSTGIRMFQAFLPVLDTDDPEILRILAERDKRKSENAGSRGRGMRLASRVVPLQGQASLPKGKRGQDKYLRLPFSFDRARCERQLMRRDLKVAWWNVVYRDEAWHLQPTLAVPYREPKNVRRVLGITFGLDAILSWTLVDEQGEIVEQGQLAPNPQIAEFIASKKVLEWDQKKGRWVGGNRFAKRLEEIAHRVSNEIVALAIAHNALLAIHDIAYVQKSGPDADMNVRFTAWNYGQLRRQASYKAPIAECGVPAFASDYIVRFTCPECDACRDKDEAEDQAATWRSKDVLRCRRCGYEGTPTGPQDSYRAAVYTLEVYYRPRWEGEKPEAETPPEETDE